MQIIALWVSKILQTSWNAAMEWIIRENLENILMKGKHLNLIVYYSKRISEQLLGKYYINVYLY